MISLLLKGCLRASGCMRANVSACVSHFLANMESKMLLEEVVEIIELTDSDHLSQAMELFNEHGFVDAESLPFMNVVLKQLQINLQRSCHRLALKV